ncbi:Ceramide Synthase 5, partial [Manis pentadactyla]
MRMRRHVDCVVVLFWVSREILHFEFWGFVELGWILGVVYFAFMAFCWFLFWVRLGFGALVFPVFSWMDRVCIVNFQRLSWFDFFGAFEGIPMRKGRHVDCVVVLALGLMGGVFVGGLGVLCTCALRSAFLGGYVRGVSVCDCARMSGGNVFFVLLLPYWFWVVGPCTCILCVTNGKGVGGLGILGIVCDFKFGCDLLVMYVLVKCVFFCVVCCVTCAFVLFSKVDRRGVSVCDCVVLRVYMDCCVSGVCQICWSMFCAFEYVLFQLVVVLCVWCVASFVTLRVKCVFLCVVCCVTAFLDGYVRGVSVCDCALVCGSECTLYGKLVVVCVMCRC